MRRRILDASSASDSSDEDTRGPRGGISIDHSLLSKVITEETSRKKDNDIEVMTARTIQRLQGSQEETKPKTKAAVMIPGQDMANPDELKQEIEKAGSDIPLKISLITSLLFKLPYSQRRPWWTAKVEYCLGLGRLDEASDGLSWLLGQDGQNTTARALLVRVQLQRGDVKRAMIELQRVVALLDEPTVELEELYGLVYSQVPPGFHSLYSSGSNVYSMIGNGTSDAATAPKGLLDLKSRVVVGAAWGNFHVIVLVSSCCHIPAPCPEGGLLTCMNGCEVLGWGDNYMGQVLGVPTKEPISRPSIFRHTIGKFATQISANKRISAAMVESGEIYVWGELPFTDKNMIKLSIQAPKIISLGGDFLLAGTHDDLIYLWGRMQHHGVEAVTSYRDMEQDHELNVDRVLVLNSIGKIQQISSGIGHALILSDQGEVYSIGCGDVGQLGLSSDVVSLEQPQRINQLQNVQFVAAGEAISVAISDQQVYAWGLVNPESLELAAPLEWEPLLSDFETRDYVTIGPREVLGLRKGGIYQWEVPFSRRFRPQPGPLTGIRRMWAGKSAQIFVKGILLPEFSKLIECPPNAVSEIPFEIKIEIHDQFGVVKVSEAPTVRVIMRSSDGFVKSGDRSENPLEVAFQGINDECLSYEVTAMKNGTYYVYVLLDEIVIQECGKCICIQKSVSQQQAEEERRRQVLEKQRLAAEKKAAKDAKRKAAQQAKEEQLARQKAETAARAAEALRKLKERKEAEAKIVEEERKWRKEIRSGGGFDLNKLAKLKK